MAATTRKVNEMDLMSWRRGRGQSGVFSVLCRYPISSAKVLYKRILCIHETVHNVEQFVLFKSEVKSSSS